MNPPTTQPFSPADVFMGALLLVIALGLVYYALKDRLQQ